MFTSALYAGRIVGILGIINGVAPFADKDMIQPPAEHLIREAAEQWYSRKLPTMAAMLVIYGLLYPERPNDQDIEWAQRILGKQ